MLSAINSDFLRAAQDNHLIALPAQTLAAVNIRSSHRMWLVATVGLVLPVLARMHWMPDAERAVVHMAAIRPKCKWLLHQTTCRRRSLEAAFPAAELIIVKERETE